MAKYNFFISYSHRDSQMVQNLSTALRERDYTVFTDMELQAGVDWVDAVADAIANSQCFIPVITDAFLSSISAKHELEYAIRISSSRAQRIFPLLFATQTLPANMRLLLSKYQITIIREPEDLEKAIAHIDQIVGYAIKSAKFYEKLSEYHNLKHPLKEAETVCQLLDLICQHWEALSLEEKRQLCPEICRLMELLTRYPIPYGQEAKTIGSQMVTTAANVNKLLDSDNALYTQDIFFCAFAVQIKYWYWDVRTDGFDLRYSGDVYDGIINPCPIEQGMAHQKPYIQAFDALFAQEKDLTNRFTAEQIDFIQKAPQFLLSRERNGILPFGTYSSPSAAKSEDEEILLSVAKFMQEGNKLFDVLQKRGIAGDFLKCLLTSYERLKNYCQIVGATDVAADCVDRIVEIRDQIVRQEGTPSDNEKAENGIKSLLGFTLHSSGNYDVFISFKSEDSDLAEKVYQLCQRHMKVPFWSKRTLPELSKSEYEDAIYGALRTSKHFVVVLSNLAYLNASWIQREMKAFDRAITEGRKPGGNFVIIATDSVYDEIIRCNKMCLDERYCGYQILKMSEYEKTLLQYIT